jgi:hypothetical protein
MWRRRAIALVGCLVVGEGAGQSPTPPPPPPALAYCCNVSASASMRCGPFPHPGKLCFDALCDTAKDAATCQKTNSTSREIGLSRMHATAHNQMLTARTLTCCV